MNQSAMVTVPCLVTVAAGVFAPGHLGELTRYLPFELVDDVLECTGSVQRRIGRAFARRDVLRARDDAVPRDRVLAGVGQMTGALEELGLPRPSEKALRDLRRRSARSR